MKVTRGAVARSSAGRDKGDFLIIMECSGSYVYVCDGKHRPVDRPKKKSLKHLYVTNTVVGEENMLTNKLIRKSLRPFKEKADKLC